MPQIKSQTVMMALASAACVFLAVAAIPGKAADLNTGEYQPRAGSPYEDPRYADLYGPEKHNRKHHRGYSDERVVPERWAHRGRNENLFLDQYGNRVRPPLPRRHAEAERYDDRDVRQRRHREFERHTRRDRHEVERFRLGENCVPRPLVMRRLQRDGWYQFSDIEFRGPRAIVLADNDNGSRYRLVIDRCSGEVVQATRIDPATRPWHRRRVGHLERRRRPFD